MLDPSKAMPSVNTGFASFILSISLLGLPKKSTNVNLTYLTPADFNMRQRSFGSMLTCISFSKINKFDPFK